MADINFGPHFDIPALREPTSTWLHKNGFINVDPTEARNTVLNPGVGQRRQQNLFITGVFAKEGWPYLSDLEYQAILPAIRLASRILSDPLVLPYFVGLLRDDTWQPNGAGNRANATGPDLAFHMVNPNATERNLYWQALYCSSEAIYFTFGAQPEPGVVANTSGEDVTMPWDNSLKGASVTFCQEYLDFMTGRSTVRNLDCRWKPGPNQESTMLRVYFDFAVMLCHEYCHAMWITRKYWWVEWSSRLTGKTKQETLANLKPRLIEPYYRNHRLAELGCAFESKIFGGKIGCIDIDGPRIIESPKGLAQQKWPGTEPYNPGPHGTMVSAAKWGTHWDTRYYIGMDWIMKLFTDQFWDRDFAKYGLEALKPPRRVGYRMMRRRVYGLDSGESPTLWQQLSSATSDSDGSSLMDLGNTAMQGYRLRQGDRSDGFEFPESATNTAPLGTTTAPGGNSTATPTSQPSQVSTATPTGSSQPDIRNWLKRPAPEAAPDELPASKRPRP